MPNQLSKIILPVKDPPTGEVTNVEFDLPGGGSTITVDDEISSSSTNPVQNKVIKEALDEKADSSSLGTAATRNVPASGNANATQVVLGSDSRLTNARPASDVSDWAKASSKPSYTASEVGAIDTSAKGANNGVAELDSSGKVPSSQLPSFVDDVLEYASIGNFPLTGEAGKIYIAQDTNKTYRWSGTAYVEISASLALGETSSTAYRGDRGKTAYDHSQTTSGNPHNVTKSDVGLGNVGNFKAVSTVASQGLSDTEKSNARANIGAGTSSFSGSYNDLTNKPTIPSAQVQSDWTQTTSTAVDYIKNKPTLGTAAAKDVPSSGNASTSQVVMGNDSRLSDSRNAKDVSSWAKASTKPSYTASEVGLGNVPNVATNDQTPTFTQASSRENIASGEKLSVIFGKIMKFFADLKTVAFSGSYNDLSNKPTIPTIPGVVSTSGNGLAPKVTDTGKFLKGDGTWATPTDTNTHRPIQVNGTQILGDNTTALNLKAGTNVSVTNSSGTVTIAATDTKYTANTTSIGSASAGTDIPADDITAWSAGTAATVTVSGTKAIFTNGTAPSLTYTAKSIPNISVTSKTVATGISPQ